MRVFRAGENPKIAQLLTAQRAARHHALDRLFQDALREAAAEDFVRADFLDAARIAGVAIIEILRPLLAGGPTGKGLGGERVCQYVLYRDVSGCIKKTK